MLNRFIGIGRWSKEIELKYTASGKAVASSTIAINEKYGGNDKTTFLPVVMWGKTAEVVAEHSAKGRLVVVDGRIEVRSWESDNGRRYVTEIIVDNVHFLDSGKNSGNSNKEPDPFAGDSTPIDISDSDLPF